MATDLLSGNFSISGTSAVDVYNGVITNTNLATGKIAPLIEQRVNDILFNGKNKANNGYNSILTYIAAEAALAVITQTSITTSTTSQPPSRISANFTTINANDAVTITDTTSSTSTTTGALKVTGGVGIGENLYVGNNLNVAGTLTLGLTLVTATATELNLLDGVTATTAELNILSGVTASATELNILDGVTATTAELNILTGVTSTAAELNILDGVTASATELNILDGVTATTAELNILTGVTASATELNILDGVTATTAELNILTGVTSTAAELNILDGVTSTAAELNILDGVTATAAELNLLDGSSAGSIVSSKVAVYDSSGILSSKPPTTGTHVANKNYVDSVAQGLSVKQSVRVATTTSGTLSTSFANGQTVDGVTLVTNDRILIKNQSNGVDNGIYIVTSGTPTRANDFDGTADVTSGAFTFVMEGATQADTGWVLTTDGTITIDSTSLSFTQFSSATSYDQTLNTTDSVTHADLTLTGALDANSTADIADTLTLSKANGTGLSVTSDATVGGTLGVTGNTTIGGTLGVTGATTLTGALTLGSSINLSSTITRATNTQQNNDSNNIATNLGDIYAKIRAMDQALTLLLQNVDISSSLNSGNPFYAGAGYGSNTATSDSLSYTS